MGQITMLSTYRATRVTVIARGGVLLSIAGLMRPGRLGTRKLETRGFEKGCPFATATVFGRFRLRLGQCDPRVVPWGNEPVNETR
jgi:hypothetical protein